jgi:hypothetical protein
MSLKLKLKHIFIISAIIISGFSANTTAFTASFFSPAKQAGHAAAAAFALSDGERYGSGYSHGCSDAKTGDHPYLDDSGGKSSHTAAFMQGYSDGYSKCNNPNSKSNGNSGVSGSYAKWKDPEPGDETLLSNQKENTRLAPSPNSTSFHAISFLKSHFKMFGSVVLPLGLVLPILGLIAFRRLHKRRKVRERKGFPGHVKENILRKQNHRCAHCRKTLNVVDWDHKNGDRSNNKENNCQALCPNCHAIKTRKGQSKR